MGYLIAHCPTLEADKFLNGIVPLMLVKIIIWSPENQNENGQFICWWPKYLHQTCHMDRSWNFLVSNYTYKRTIVKWITKIKLISLNLLHCNVMVIIMCICKIDVGCLCIFECFWWFCLHYFTLYAISIYIILGV